MFDFIRRFNKVIMVAILFFLVLAFALSDYQRYSNGEGRSEAVAKGDGFTITRAEWDAQHRNEADRLRQQMPNADPAMLDSDAARYATLENMVRDRVLVAAAGHANLVVPDERLTRMFAEDPAMATFRGPDGKFDRQRFVLATGRTPEQYEAALRADLTTQQVLSGITSTALASKAQTDVTFNAIYDQREVQVARFDPKALASKVTVSDADLEAYYKDHTSEFQAPEQVDIEYIVLDLEAAKRAVNVNESELKAYYDQNKERFTTKEERRASHILIAAAKDAPAAVREKAKEKAQQILAEVRRAPSSFSDLARKNSQDEGSAKQGGKLDFVSRGAMVKPFEDAMFAMKKGDISDLVESDFGYHIIRLDDIKPAVVAPFDQVRAQIEDDFRTQQATQEFAKAAEAMTDLVYQQGDSLQPAAEKLKLQVQKAMAVTRTPAVGAKGVLASRNFLAALFAPESLDRKHNTEAIEIGSNQLASGRVTRYSPARTLPFAEVKDKVREQLVAQRAEALAQSEGEAKLAAWQSAPADADLGAAITVSREQAQKQPAALVEAVLRADNSKLPDWMGVKLGAEGYAVVRVNKDIPRAMPSQDVIANERNQLARATADAEATAYYNLLKDQLKVEILVPRPAPTSALRG